MKKDSVEKDSFFSGISSVVKDYARINWPCIILVAAACLITMILALVRNAAAPGGFTYTKFFSSLVYHALVCCLVFFFCSKVYFPDGFEAREIAAECVFYLLTYTLTLIVGVYGNFAGEYSICIIIPAVFCVYMTAIIFGQTNALFFSIILSLSVFECTSWGLLPFFYTLATCLAAARIVRTIKTRSAMVLVSVIQALVNVFLYEITNLTTEL